MFLMQAGRTEVAASPFDETQLRWQIGIGFFNIEGCHRAITGRRRRWSSVGRAALRRGHPRAYAAGLRARTGRPAGGSSAPPSGRPHCAVQYDESLTMTVNDPKVAGAVMTSAASDSDARLVAPARPRSSRSRATRWLTPGCSSAASRSPRPEHRGRHVALAT
jgi:hypothetical protein